MGVCNNLNTKRSGIVLSTHHPASTLKIKQKSEIQINYKNIKWTPKEEKLRLINLALYIPESSVKNNAKTTYQMKTS